MRTVKIVLLLAAYAMLTVGCQGHKGDEGDQGESITGPQGPAGSNGQDGHDGAPGAQGPAGADGQIATIVTLCPGVSVYPGTFVEVALLINGELYGVYSANGGFLTLLPPGNYTSNGIGSACNFTVNADRTVSH